MLKNFDKNQNYYKFYKRKNTPIVFIHGVGLDQDMWFPQVRYFKNNSKRCLQFKNSDIFN